MLASEMVSRVRIFLLDPDKVYWTDAELLDYLNVSTTAVVSVRPSAYTITTSFTITQSQNKQTVPASAQEFLGITRNLSPTLRAVTQVDMRHMNASNPNWGDDTSNTEVQHFMVIDDDPKIFWVYPKVNDVVSVEIRYASIPVRMVAGDTIPLDLVYESAIEEYMLYLSYVKNAKRGDVTKASLHLQNSINFLGLKDTAEIKRYAKFTDTTATA